MAALAHVNHCAARPQMPCEVANGRCVFCATAPCPQCGHELQIVTDGLVGDLVLDAFHVRGTEPRRVWRPAPFAACAHCEFCVEIK